tara:strand:+ start:1021 stop:1491 length:471 start_codon:yes stop_codon:yes gene_type:complete
MFKLLILDIDGVMTNGTKAYNTEGVVCHKYFHDHDFTAIKRLKGANIEVCFLSGDLQVNQIMASKRKIDFYHNTPGTDKIEYLAPIMNKYKVTEKETAYIGDDLYDLNIMQSVSFPFCPSNAVKDILELCLSKGHVLQTRSGEGVVKELYSYVYQK